MTIEQQIAAAAARAEALAAPIIARGEAAGAAEVDRLKARWARLVVDNAAGDAATFPAADFEKWRAELGANLKAAESTDHAHAVLDRKDTELREALAARALEAWRTACEKLAAAECE
ncbi:MAG: hypothetical protein ACFCUW_02295 [Kiloniellaceae bacterium]